MNLRFVFCLAVALATTAAFADGVPVNRRDAAALWSAEGLQKIEIRGIQVAYARPGASLARYHEVAIAPIDVTFRREPEAMSVRNPLRMTEKDEERMKARLARIVHEELSAALRERGFALVSDPRGAGTLEIDASITDVHLTAPDVRTPDRVDVYARSAGEMTLVAGLRDGASGEHLMRVFDRAQTIETTFPHHVTVVESDGQLRNEARAWGRALAEEIAGPRTR